MMTQSRNMSRRQKEKGGNKRFAAKKEKTNKNNEAKEVEEKNMSDMRDKDNIHGDKGDDKAKEIKLICKQIERRIEEVTKNR